MGTLLESAKKSLPLLQVRSVLQLGARRARGKRSPFQVTLSLTNRCNFRCTYCHIPLQHREEMDTREWRGAIDELAAAGMGRASLIGGEPLLRPDAGDIVRHLRDRGVHAAMNTNGWLVPDRIEDLMGLSLACITLDGTPEVHDRERRKGSYDKVILAIEALRSRGIPVVTMSVLTPSAAEESSIDHVLSVAKAHGTKAFFQLEHHADVDVALPIAPKLSDERVANLARI